MEQSENKMRDRLIELLNQRTERCLEDGCRKDCPWYRKGDKCKNHAIADHLLENGVFIMPFEIGGFVYVIQDGGVKPARIESQYYVSKKRKTNIFARSLDGECDWLFDLGDVDKTIFMSKYDAEQALKGEHHVKIH